MRRVILHYHLFKNAGTSLDHVLQQNLWGRWASAEFSVKGANTADVAQWITGMPRMVAFSSHTMIGPPPQIDGVRLTPIVLLRDPVARIYSAYRFERQQHAETYGAQLARAHDFKGYVHARLARMGDRQCRNFQTERLASMIPGPARELIRAKEALRLINATGTLGLVTAFPQALQRLKRCIADDFPNFSPLPVHQNPATRSDEAGIPEGLRRMLVQVNEDDLRLLDYAQSLLAGAETATA